MGDESTTTSPAYGVVPEAGGGPVTDWATDFDHADPAYNRNAHEIWADLRDRCPVAHTDRYHGAWLPVTHADVAQIAHDTDNYTSRAVVVSNAQEFAAGADRRRAADHQRPAVPPPRPTAAAAAVRPAQDRGLGARGPPAVQRAARRDRGRAGRRHGRDRRVEGVHAEHPGERHRPDARLPAGGRRACSAASCTTRWRRSTRRWRSAARRSPGSTPTSTSRCRSTSPTRATTSPRTCSMRRSSTSR